MQQWEVTAKKHNIYTVDTQMCENISHINFLQYMRVGNEYLLYS